LLIPVEDCDCSFAFELASMAGGHPAKTAVSRLALRKHHDIL
jgi:hypothetical protein